MFPRGVLFSFLFGVLHVALCAPLENEKIDPVNLSNFCFYVKVNGNTPSKSPVILIHGLGSSKADWNDIYEVLAFDTGRRVCALDLRNHGDSPWNNRSDVEAMTVDLEHFLDKKNFQKVNLIGHSLGGKIAVHFALKHPERVDSLVVEDMRPNGVTPNGLGFVKAAFKFLQEAIKAVPKESNEDTAKKAIIEHILKRLADIGFNDSIEGNPENILAIRFVDGKWQFKMNLDLFTKALENPAEFLTPSSGLYNGPAMFIYGEKSVFDVAGDESNIRKLFPKAQLQPVAGAGHIIHAAYRQFVDEVIKFLNKKRLA